VPRTRSSGWGRAGHRRAVLIGAVVLIVILGGGVAAWAEVGTSSAGYRLTSVTRANIATALTVVGTVEPISDAAPSFQVGGQVTSVTATPGQQVTAGQTLATLDTSALSDTVSSDESTLNADEAKLVEDEESESSAASSNTGSNGSSNAKSPTTTTTSTTSPSHSGSGGQDATVTADQKTLTQDESTLSTDQQMEAADLTQAQTDCTSANTGTPTGQATCEAALETVQSDEEQVSKDQETVSKDETALGQALDAESSGGSSSTAGGTTGNSGAPTQSGHAVDTSADDFTGNTGTGTGNTGTGTGSPGGSAGTGGGDSSDADTPQQIASDQANIDTAEAQLINAEQSVKEATLTSPISGTVVSIGINVGDTVSADSSTEIITIIGTKAYEVEGTLDSSQVPTVKVGQSASVEVDGADGTMDGTVSQVGPVQSSDSGYSYPVVVALPATTDTLFTGSTSNVTITTGSVSNVVAVPTSAVQTFETRSYVLELEKGQLTRKVVKVGMVGDEYTQVLSGLSPGQSVVLADFSQAVPSTSTNTDEFGGGLGGLGGGGGFLGGGGGGFFQRFGGGGPGGAVKSVTIGG
jgi:multidrug efflux pump subunit AcrA (membrane-fusion protein)